MERDEQPIQNPLLIRKRTLEEALKYLATKHPGYRFGVVFDREKWLAQAQVPGKKPVSFEIKGEVDTVLALTMAIYEANLQDDI